ncbi:hypothetical protein [Arthrobacter sp. 4R501]|nr:hypothetical protein [Arthrobacter sp. 4R501]
MAGSAPDRLDRRRAFIVRTATLVADALLEEARLEKTPLEDSRS